jgi:hypothetical protein
MDNPFCESCAQQNQEEEPENWEPEQAFESDCYIDLRYP